jgi:acylphosphatase
MLADRTRAHVRVTGRVQGVGFRFFTSHQANRFNVTGWVRNKGDGSVEIEAEASRDSVEAFLTEIQRGPRFGNVDDIEIEWITPRGEPTFEVIG